jgi:ferrous iron transport protein A
MNAVPLGSLAAGTRAQVAGFMQEDAFAQRLMQLGLIEGASVEILRCAPSGDPIEISVMGYALSLRRAEANLILVSPEPT